MAHFRKRSRRARGGPRRRSIRGGLSDHTGDRDSGMARAQSRQDRGRSAAGRGRARGDQHDHRRLLRRHAGAHGNFRTGPVVDDRGSRPRDRRRSSRRPHRRDARRAVDRNPHQVGTGRPQHRGVRISRRRPTSRGGAAVGGRLPFHHPVGDVSRRGAADARDRAVGPVHRASAGRDRATGGGRLHRTRDARLPSSPAPTNATRSRPTAFHRWRSRGRAEGNIRPTA